jgi:hypothetical protein
LSRFLEPVPLPLVESDGLADHPANVLVRGGGEPVFLLDEELGDLAFAGGQLAEFLLGRGKRGRDSRLHQFGKAGDDAGVDLVGFGELA